MDEVITQLAEHGAPGKAARELGDLVVQAEATPPPAGQEGAKVPYHLQARLNLASSIAETNPASVLDSSQELPPVSVAGTSADLAPTKPQGSSAISAGSNGRASETKVPYHLQARMHLDGSKASEATRLN